MRKTGIYIWLNIFNDKIYIGSSCDISNRKGGHLKRLRKNNHENTDLQSDFTLFGENAFKFIILEECKRYELIDKEIGWITKKKSFGEGGYNKQIPDEADRHKCTQEFTETCRKAYYEANDIKVSYEEWFKKLNKERSRVKRKRNTSGVVQIDPVTGSILGRYKTIKECGDTIGFTENQLKKLGFILNGYGKFKWRKSYKGYIFVYADEYDSTFDYRNYRCKTVREKQIIPNFVNENPDIAVHREGNRIVTIYRV